MIINREDLSKFIIGYCDSNYQIGLHGISKSRLKDFFGDITVDDAVNKILNEGLRVFSCRTINGTVRFFGRTDLKDDREKLITGLNNYYYGSEDYIIVAIPVILKDQIGNELYLGKNNLKSIYSGYMGTTGSEKTSLSDAVILRNDRVLPEFILGSFKMLDYNGTIDLKLNDKHMLFNGNVVSVQLFEEIFRSARYYLLSPDTSVELFSKKITSEDKENIKKIINELDKKIRNNEIYGFIDNPSVCETYIQLLNEDVLEKLDNKEEKEFIDNFYYKKRTK